MSQVTEQSVRFQTALASIKLIQASAVLDLTEDDFDFLTSNKVWIATDRSDRKSGSAGMPRPSSYAVFCLKKKLAGVSRIPRWLTFGVSGRRTGGRRRRRGPAASRPRCRVRDRTTRHDVSSPRMR